MREPREKADVAVSAALFQGHAIVRATKEPPRDAGHEADGLPPEYEYVLTPRGEAPFDPAGARRNGHHGHGQPIARGLDGSRQQVQAPAPLITIHTPKR